MRESTHEVGIRACQRRCLDDWSDGWLDEDASLGGACKSLLALINELLDRLVNLIELGVNNLHVVYVND